MSQPFKFVSTIILVFTFTATAVLAKEFEFTTKPVLVADTQASPNAQQQVPEKVPADTTQQQAVTSSEGNGIAGQAPKNAEIVPQAKRYPTADEVYYVLACMEVNGKDANGLGKCSCAINALEERLPYEQFKDAQIAVTLRQAGGRNAAILRETPPMKEIVNGFTKAQRAANVECFGLDQRAAGAGR